MLKIEEKKKVIEYKGEQYELCPLSAKAQTAFALKVEKEKDPSKQCDFMIDFVSKLGIPKKTVDGMNINALQSIIEYVSDNGKK